MQSTTFSNLDWKVQYLQEAPNHVQQEGDKIFFNFPITMNELKYLSFIHNILESNKGNFAFLGSTQKMQDDFTLWLKDVKWYTEPLEIDALITSIWTKSRREVDSILKTFYPEQIEDEEGKIQYAQAYKNQNLSHYTGKMFTPRQANLLLDSLNSIAASGKNQKK